MDLRIRRDQCGATIVSLSGEMDMYTSHLLRDSVTVELADGQDALIIDCSGLNYIDSSGIGVFLHTFARCRKAGSQVWFAGVSGSVRRVIELTSLLGFLPIVESISEAAALASEARS